MPFKKKNIVVVKSYKIEYKVTVGGGNGKLYFLGEEMFF